MMWWYPVINGHWYVSMEESHSTFFNMTPDHICLTLGTCVTPLLSSTYLTMYVLLITLPLCGVDLTVFLLAVVLGMVNICYLIRVKSFVSSQVLMTEWDRRLCPLGLHVHQDSGLMLSKLKMMIAFCRQRLGNNVCN